MKTLSTLSILFTASLAFTPCSPAQKQKQPETQGDQELVQIVRTATQRYQNVANAAPDYGPVLGCVSGSDHGAMGIHYVNGSLVKGETLLSDGQLDASKPQALIYEPQSNGELKLVAVEFILLASALPAGAAPPQVDGHLMLYIDAPNRYGLPAFYELHVWAWSDNPQGTFVDWNNNMSCPQ